MQNYNIIRKFSVEEVGGFRIHFWSQSDSITAAMKGFEQCRGKCSRWKHEPLRFLLGQTAKKVVCANFNEIAQQHWSYSR